jgi:hypothetical protein
VIDNSVFIIPYFGRSANPDICGRSANPDITARSANPDITARSANFTAVRRGGQSAMPDRVMGSAHKLGPIGRCKMLQAIAQ